LVDVLQHDVDVRGREHLGDLSAHRAGADNGGFEYEHDWESSGGARAAATGGRACLTGAEGYNDACSAASVANRRKVRASASFCARRMNRASTTGLSGPPTDTE